MEIMTVDGIEVQRSQAAAIAKRTTSYVSNAVRYAYRCQPITTAKRNLSDGSNAGTNG